MISARLPVLLLDAIHKRALEEDRSTSGRHDFGGEDPDRSERPSGYGDRREGALTAEDPSPGHSTTGARVRHPCLGALVIRTLIRGTRAGDSLARAGGLG
jgi:hypothetical protein